MGRGGKEEEREAGERRKCMGRGERELGRDRATEERIEDNCEGDNPARPRSRGQQLFEVQTVGISCLHFI